MEFCSTIIILREVSECVGICELYFPFFNFYNELSGSYSVILFEYLGKIREVVKAAHFGDLLYRKVGGAEDLLGVFTAQLVDVDHSGVTRNFFELTQKMILAYADVGGNIINRYLFVDIVLDVVDSHLNSLVGVAFGGDIGLLHGGVISAHKK